MVVFRASSIAAIPVKPWSHPPGGLAAPSHLSRSRTVGWAKARSAVPTRFGITAWSRRHRHLVSNERLGRLCPPYGLELHQVAPDQRVIRHRECGFPAGWLPGIAATEVSR